MTTRQQIDWLAIRAGFGPAAKALMAEVCGIAYLGLSVTAQREGYRSLLHAWIVKTSGIPHIAINAAVGGVGSVSAAFLVDDLVLPRRPGLCFIECTTGDFGGKTPRQDVRGAVEGIVRKLAAIECQPCILHLFRRDQTFSPPDSVVQDYERVADHYGVPSINVGRCIEDAIQTSAVDVDLLFRDAVHTTPAGSELTADIIGRGLTSILAGSAGVAPLWRSPHAPYCCSDHYHRSRIELVREEQVENPGAAASGEFRTLYRYRDVDETNAIHFQSAADDLKGLLVIIGPDSGVIQVSAGGVRQEYQLLDDWCRYYRLSTVVFETAIPAGISVAIRPASSGTCLKIIGFLVRQPRAPERE